MRAWVLVLFAACTDGSTDTNDSGPPGTGVVINELNAGNTAGLTDESGDFADWLELHNAGDTGVDVSGWTLTDGTGVRPPWPLPAGTSIDAGGYLIVFCDEEEGQGPLHASFKLARAGETVTFADPDGAIVDEVTYPPQYGDNVSYGRVPDASANWGQLDPPTPEASND